MKVYVITAGVYSDYHIVAVTLDKGKANEMKRIAEKNQWDNEANVEVYDTDWTEIALKNGDFYSVYFPAPDEKGASIKVEEVDGYDLNYKEGIDSFFGAVTVNLWAKDKETALKVAAERKAKYEAEKQGI